MRDVRTRQMLGGWYIAKLYPSCQVGGCWIPTPHAGGLVSNNPPTPHAGGYSFAIAKLYTSWCYSYSKAITSSLSRYRFKCIVPLRGYDSQRDTREREGERERERDRREPESEGERGRARERRYLYYVYSKAVTIRKRESEGNSKQ